MTPGAFELLKAGDGGPESVKQLKISLADMPKTLSNFFTLPAAQCTGMALTGPLGLILG